MEGTIYLYFFSYLVLQIPLINHITINQQSPKFLYILSFNSSIYDFLFISISASYEEFIIAVDFLLSVTSPEAIYWYPIFEKCK